MPETVGKLVKYGNRCEFGNYSRVNVLHLTRCIDANIDKPFRYYLQHWKLQWTCCNILNTTIQPITTVPRRFETLN